MAEEQQKTEEELLAEWENMAGDDDAPAEGAAAASGDAEAGGGEAAAGEVGERILDQDEIDSLLGVDTEDGNSKGGIRALLDQSIVNYEKLPMLEVIFDKFERFLSTSLRHFTADNVDVSIVSTTSVRFSDYLNSVPLPAGLVVVNAMGLDDYIMLTYESQCIYAVVDVLLGGRKSNPAKIEGRSFTMIERKIMDSLTEIVLHDLSEAFGPVAPVQFKAERMEVNPRFAVITQETNVCILVTVRLSLEGREGNLQFCLPYATLEPVREQLLQQFMGEKFGQDNIWENHLSQELYSTSITLSAVLEERQFDLDEVMQWRVGDTIMLEVNPEDTIKIECGNIHKLMGIMGRSKDYIAVRVSETITDVNNKRGQG